MIDPEDIAYEDSVSSETFDVEAEWERQNSFEPELPEDFTGVDCWERYEDCSDGPYSEGSYVPAPEEYE